MNARKGRLRPADSKDAPPATQQEAQRESVAQPEAEGASFDPPPRKSLRSYVRLRSVDVPSVLLVTEERTVAETVRRGLSQAGWFVLRRSTLRDAAHAIRQHHVALVIAHFPQAHPFDPEESEVVPQGSAGFRTPSNRRSRITLRHLRALAGCPILWIGDFAGMEREIRALEQGADAYLAGPFSPEEIASEAAWLLRMRSNHYQVEVGRNLALDVASRAVIIGGRSVALPDNAFTLLAALAHSPGKALETSLLCRRLGLRLHPHASEERVMEGVRYLRRLLRGTGVRIRCSTGHVMLVGAEGSSNASGEGRGGTGSS